MQLSELRTSAARVLQVVCTLIAAMIALAAVAVAARDSVNADNVLVEIITQVANIFDGPFSRTEGVFDFNGSQSRNALVNWGIAAAVWLAIGRVLSTLVRP